MPSYRTVFRSALVLSLILSLALLAGCAMPGFLKPQKPEKPAQPRGTTVALVVPSGKVASIVTALTSGARLAAQQQAGTGPVTVRVIATQGNWLQELAALPENTVIGGPLSEASYKKMKAAGIMDKKVVFAFLGKLDAGDEGTVAWRFYPSLEDQIDAVVKLSVDRLDIRTMASFGPADNFSVAVTAVIDNILVLEVHIRQETGIRGDISVLYRKSLSVNPLMLILSKELESCPYPLGYHITVRVLSPPLQIHRYEGIVLTSHLLL